MTAMDMAITTSSALLLLHAYVSSQRLRLWNPDLVRRARHAARPVQAYIEGTIPRPGFLMALLSSRTMAGSIREVRCCLRWRLVEFP